MQGEYEIAKSFPLLPLKNPRHQEQHADLHDDHQDQDPPEIESLPFVFHCRKQGDRKNQYSENVFHPANLAV